MQINSMTPKLNRLRPGLKTTTTAALNLQGSMEIVLPLTESEERRHVCGQREEERQARVSERGMSSKLETEYVMFVVHGDASQEGCDLGERRRRHWTERK